MKTFIYKCCSSVRSNPKPNTSFRRYGWHWQSGCSAIKLFILHRSPWRNKLDRFSLVRFVHPTLILVSKTRAYESGAPFMCSVRQQTRFKSVASHKHSSLLVLRVRDNHRYLIHMLSWYMFWLLKQWLCNQMQNWCSIGIYYILSLDCGLILFSVF
jgi:hypothetical protein